MSRFSANAELSRLAVLATVASVIFFLADTNAEQIIHVRAAGFDLGKEKSASNLTNHFQLALDDSGPIPFTQSAVKQDSAPAQFGPNPKIPYFTVRFAMPIPPENLTNTFATLTGIDPMVFTHNHSPGFEILPNGDCLAIYFSTPPGKAEADISTSFVQARLRYGSEEWDLPELFFKTKNFNDQSGLLWNDNGKIWFFGGGRDISDSIPFRIATSTDNGESWTLNLPQLDKPAKDFTAQPITSAFRGRPVPLLSNLNPIYFAMDADSSQSFLWRSTDDGIHWTQMPGRTGGRHSVIVPLDDKGNLLSIGGKNAAVNGWSPENTSSNWGTSWSKSVESPFPPLGSGQRPSMIRLADGNLFFVSDAYLQKAGRTPPTGWTHGNEPFVAISTNNGASWHIKALPVTLPKHDLRKFGTVGYVTARQAPNGIIHILTTVSEPCLHYELNEAWIWSDAGDIAPENSGGVVRTFSEKYPNGKVRSRWLARICPDGRYLLDGIETDFYDNGVKQHEVTYAKGRKTGEETFWSRDGKKIWSWQHDLENNRAVWTQYSTNGTRCAVSSWNTKPTARDLNRSFFGLVADGPAYQCNPDGDLSGKFIFTNGIFAGEAPLKKMAEK